MNVRQVGGRLYGRWARLAMPARLRNAPASGSRGVSGTSRFGRRGALRMLALVLALHPGPAAFVELVPRHRSVHQGDTYTIHRGHSFGLNVFPLLGPGFALGGHHRLTIQPKSGATRVKIVDVLEDLARDYPFLFVQQGPRYLLK